GPLRTDVSLGRQPDGTGPWHFFDNATPGAPNSTAGYLSVAEAPEVSVEGGRFASPVTVSLAASAGLEIHYTTDGSTPTKRSPQYLGPFYVQNALVLRARTVAPGFLPSEIVTNTYVVGEDPSLPVVSISTDPPLLWDNATGIYAFPPEDQAACPSFPHFCANFWEDREIAAHVEVFEIDGRTILNSGTGVAIVGGWSRALPQKSLGLCARGRYGSPAFDASLFPNRPYTSYQTFLLRNSGNDWDSSMLRDGFLQTLVASADIDIMSYRPTILYLNGQYWGLHNLREKINEHYAAALGEVDPDEVDVLGLDEERTTSAPEVLEGDTEHFEQLLALLGAIDMTSDTAYDQVDRMMDLDSFIDYQITQIFVGNTDWPGNNVKLWRPRTADGRWRWVLFDLDFGFGRWNPEDYQHNTLAFATEPNGPQWPNPPWSTFFLRRLLENSDFRIAFVNRYADFLNTMFEERTILDVLDSLQTKISGEIPDHLGRWGQSYSYWLGQLANLRYYARNRPPAAESHLRSFFGLGNPVPVTVSSTSGGHVRVNRLDIRESEWTGQYYPPMPVPLRAVPDPGYRFVGWAGSVSSVDPSISVTPLRPLSVEARFEMAPVRDFDIVVNEVHYNPPGDMPSEDWVELISLESEAVNLAGWTLVDGGGNRFTIP
ncbi:MAG: CotH kinase family protein, partial [Rhodothermales bacterium]|nr:CotH kinase family protein [Rhodothermales bacterium]